MNNIKVLNDKRFKNVITQLKIVAPLQGDKVNARSLLANILNATSEKYNTKQKLSNELDRLYGASFNFNASIVGNLHVFSFKVKTIDPKFINNEINLIEEQFKIIAEFLYNPYLVNGLFDEKTLLEAKRNLKNSKQRVFDDPSSLCLSRALQYAGQNQSLGCGVSDDLTLIDKVSNEEVYETYLELINECRKDVMVLGNVDENLIQQLANKYIKADQNQMNVLPNYKLKDLVEKKEVIETKQISQSYLTSVYKTDTLNNESDYNVLRVANMIFGQMPTSLLFQEVREKNSLCYSIYSSLYPYDSAMIVSTGVDNKNLDKAKALIEVEFNRICSGDFDEQLISVAKSMIFNALKGSKDDIDAIFAFNYRNIVFNDDLTVEKTMAEIAKVSKEDIVRVMNKVSLVATYMLKGELND